MFKLLYISWFFIFVKSMSIERPSLGESHYDQVRFTRADFPPLDYRSGKNNDDYITTELKVNRFDPRELEYQLYHSDPRIEMYPNVPMEMYPTAPLQIEPRANFESQFQARSSVSELQHPFNDENSKFHVNPSEPFSIDEDPEDKLAILNEPRFSVVSYFVPNNQNPNALRKRSKQESSEYHQMARPNVNKKVNRSKQEMKYEQEIKRDRKNKGEPGSEELYSEVTQENSSELDNQTTPNNFQ